MKAAVPLCNDRPLVTAALGFCGGIALCDALTGTWLPYAMCLFAAVMLYALWRRRYRPLAFFAALLLGMARLLFARALGPPAVPGFLAPLETALQALRAQLLAATDALFYDNAPLLRAMLWGEKTLVPAADTQAFRNAGIAHVLAISGLHISFFLAVWMAVLPKGKPRLRFCVIALFLLLYCAVAAFPASLVRASVMALCVLGAGLLYARGDLLCSLALAALVILFAAPEQLFRAGFQLSFTAVLGIALLYTPFLRALEKLPFVLAQSCAVSLSATIGTLPLTLLHFRSLPVYSLFANLFLLPLIPFALIPAFCAVALYPLGLSGLPAFVGYHMLQIVKGLSYRISALPGSVLPLPAPPPLLCALCYLAMFAASPYVLRSAVWKRRACLLLCAGVLFLFGCVILKSK